MDAIKGFFDEHRFLCNFFPCDNGIVLDGERYPTTEHAYQAAKSLDQIERQTIRLAPTPRLAKSMGRKVKLRPDWEEVKFAVMEDVVRQKFANDPKLCAWLLATGDAYLEETNHWGDVIWGVCDGVGQNHLGRILMKVRDELAVRTG